MGRKALTDEERVQAKIKARAVNELWKLKNKATYNEYQKNYYRQNREHLDAILNCCTREQIKILMIIYCYGGEIQKWVNVQGIDVSNCLPEAVHNNKIVEISMM